MVDVEPEQVVATLARIKPQLEAQDFELVERLWNTLMLVMRLVRMQRVGLAWLRRLLGMSSSEKTRDVTGAQEPNAPRQDSQDHPAATAGAEEPERNKPKGHGRLGVLDYPNAVHHAYLRPIERGTFAALDCPQRGRSCRGSRWADSPPCRAAKCGRPKVESCLGCMRRDAPAAACRARRRVIRAACPSAARPFRQTGGPVLRARRTGRRLSALPCGC